MEPKTVIEQQWENLEWMRNSGYSYWRRKQKNVIAGSMQDGAGATSPQSVGFSLSRIWNKCTFMCFFYSSSCCLTERPENRQNRQNNLHCTNQSWLTQTTCPPSFNEGLTQQWVCESDRDLAATLTSFCDPCGMRTAAKDQMIFTNTPNGCIQMSTGKWLDAQYQPGHLTQKERRIIFSTTQK